MNREEESQMIIIKCQVKTKRHSCLKSEKPETSLPSAQHIEKPVSYISHKESISGCIRIK